MTIPDEAYAELLKTIFVRPTLDDVYRKFGETAEAAQLLETELGNMLLETRCMDEGLLDKKDPARAAEILGSVSWRSGGVDIDNLINVPSPTRHVPI